MLVCELRHLFGEKCHQISYQVIVHDVRVQCDQTEWKTMYVETMKTIIINRTTWNEIKQQTSKENGYQPNGMLQILWFIHDVRAKGGCFSKKKKKANGAHTFYKSKKIAYAWLWFMVLTKKKMEHKLRHFHAHTSYFTHNKTMFQCTSVSVCECVAPMYINSAFYKIPKPPSVGKEGGNE